MISDVRSTTNIQLQFKDEETLHKEIMQLTKWQLCLLGKLITDVREEKYPRRRKVLYGNLPRCMRKEELLVFFMNVHKDFRDFFLVQFFFGLRINEVNNIEFLENQMLIRINDKKCKRVEYLPVHESQVKLLRRFKKKNHKVARDYFRKCIKSCGLHYVYAQSSNGKNLSQFSPHSLRHSAINIFAKQVNDSFKRMSFSRHDKKTELGTTSTYLFYDMEEMRVDYEKAFKDYFYLIGGST